MQSFYVGRMQIDTLITDHFHVLLIRLLCSGVKETLLQLYLLQDEHRLPVALLWWSDVRPQTVTKVQHLSNDILTLFRLDTYMKKSHRPHWHQTNEWSQIKLSKSWRIARRCIFKYFSDVRNWEMYGIPSRGWIEILILDDTILPNLISGSLYLLIILALRLELEIAYQTSGV